ncbi:cyclin-J18-like isoform X4 [Primulina eburnea]|uniref:cyclin-J18-like isoform X4 n=1 Tax=Primulina eburnea TaxID=1245227 RepID=UPI003C6C0A04
MRNSQPKSSHITHIYLRIVRNRCFTHTQGDAAIRSGRIPHPICSAAGSLSDCEVLCIIAIRRAFLSSSVQIHDMTPLSVEVLKSFGDDFIKEQHYTKRDLLDAVLKFEIGTSHIAFIMVDELLSQLKVIARVGEHVNFEVCMDVLDLLYEKEATSLLYNSPCFLAASILVVAYVISVPAQKWEFPILPWVKFVTSYKEEEIMCCVRDILKHIFEPQADYGDQKLN